MNLILLLMLSIYSTAFAQQEERANNSDLRTADPLFAVHSLNEAHKSYALNVFGGGEYVMDDSKSGQRYKISHVDAKSLDEEFVSKFITMKYSMSSESLKNCKKSFELSMRGETQKVCAHEKNKIEMIAGILKKIQKVIQVK